MKKRIKALIFQMVILLRIDSWLAQLAWKVPMASKLIPPPRHYGHNYHRKVKRSGVHFNINPGDLMQWQLMVNLKDVAIEKAIRLILAKKSSEKVVLDVGANCGHFCLKIADAINKAGIAETSVYAFEPNPEIFKKLIGNIQLNNGISQLIKPMPYAVGSESGTATISVPFRNSGAGSLAYNYDNEPHRDYIVEIVSIDGFVNSQAIANVDFLKIDVETFEPHVLLGAQQVIDKYRPTIYVEFINDNSNGFSNDFIFNFLKNRGYTVCREENDRFYHVDDFNDLKNISFCNLLAVNEMDLLRIIQN